VWLERKREQLKNSTESAKRSLSEESTRIENYSQQLTGQEKQLDSITQNIHELNTKLDIAKEKLANKKSIALPEIAEEIKRIYDRQKKLLAQIENIHEVEELRTLKAEAKTITSELAQLDHRLGGAKDGNPHEVITLQDTLRTLLSQKDKLVQNVNDIKVKLQVSKERESTNQKTLASFEAEYDKIQKDLSRLGSEKSTGERATDIETEEKTLSQKLQVTEQLLSNINSKLASFNQDEQKKKEEVFELQNTFSKKQSELNSITAELNVIKIELAKIEIKQEDIEREMVDEMNDEERQVIFELQKPPQAQSSLFSEIQKLKRQLELIGGIDPQVAEEYKETKERHDFLTKQSNDLNKAIEDLEEAIENLDETIKKQFHKAFEQINKHFTKYFKILFSGGNASLSLVKEETKEADDDLDDEENDKDDDDEEEVEKTSRPSAQKKKKVITGIDVHATPPGKRLKGIGMLSGGERALTSIALICAIIHNNPSPFVILDEVDAALDESNSLRFASIIDKLDSKTQFILITHNRATMNKAKILYGITMGDDGVSKLLSIDMEEAEKVIEN